MFARKAVVSSRTAAVDPQSKPAVAHPPEKVPPTASQASAPAFTCDFSLIPARAGMPAPKRAVDPPGGVARRGAGDARTSPIVDEVLASPGHPLDAESRAFAEPL